MGHGREEAGLEGVFHGTGSGGGKRYYREGGVGRAEGTEEELGAKEG